jgi:Protein kinase domain/TIR domain
VGSVFAGHRIDSIVGEGGHGVVYRATNLGPSRTVALKVVKGIMSDDAKARERFCQEATITSSISNPHLLPIYQVGEERENLFFTTRYVDGVDLGRLIDEEGALEPSVAARIVGQIASALDALHAHGIVHRDLKPANVLIDRGEEEVHAYVTDFGLAIDSAQPLLDSPGQMLGSLDYMSPEMIRGEARVDARSDIYGVGALLYEMLTGERVFSEARGMRILWAHLQDPRPSVVGTGVPEEFDNVIAKAMAIDREDRYLSAGDLGRAAIAVAAGRLPSRAQRNVARGEAAPGGLGSEPEDSDESAQANRVLSATSTGRAGHRDRSAGPRIFISYRRDDVPDATDRLVEALVTRFGKQNVFVDVDSIEIGAEFAKVIGDYVARSDVLLAVIGRRWLDAVDDDGKRRIEDPGDYVRTEIEAALARDVRVVPVLVHGASMPRQAQLPDSLWPMVARNAAELPRQWFAPAVDQLIAAIERIRSDE